MKKLLAVGLFAICSVVHAQDPFLAMCGADYKKKPILFCYSETYLSISQLIDARRRLVDNHAATPTIDPAGAEVALAGLNADLARVKTFNSPFVPALRAELKKSPAALALLPKLLAAVDVSLSGKDVEPSEPLVVYRARIARNHAAAVSLLKEVEFSR